jgi:peptidylprolyl isomerase
MVLILALLAVIAMVVVAYSMLGNDLGSSENVLSSKVQFETSMGNITIQLRDDMPITTENFKNLVQQGTYEGTIFHRVIDEFMIQGGDPTGTGYGDPSMPNIKDEFSEKAENNKNRRGTVAMANTGAPNSGSSQFFINVVYNSHLDNVHPVFGEVIEGMEVVDRISEVATDANDRPLEEVTLIKAQLVD